MYMYPIDIPTNQDFLNKWYAWFHARVAKQYKRNRERILDTAQGVRVRWLAKDGIGRWFFKPHSVPGFESPHLCNELVDRPEAERILGGTNLSDLNRIARLLHNIDNFPIDQIQSEIRKVFGSTTKYVEFESLIGRLIDDNPISEKTLRGELEIKLRVEFKEGYQNIPNGALTFISAVNPVEGKRSDPSSLWSVTELLQYARFDYDRFYYSPQNHTISTPHILRLLGYWDTEELEKYGKEKKLPDREDLSFGALQSLYRQNRLLPAEMTEHSCSGNKKTCSGCERARRVLRGKKLSLVDDWRDPKVAKEVLKLRWNDSQLHQFLRDWKRGNTVKSTPRYIMRETNQGIERGLLKYAEMLIGNEIRNEFKRIARADEVENMVFNNGMSPEFSNSETRVIETSDENDGESVLIHIDPHSLAGFRNLETHHDLNNLANNADLSEDERSVLLGVDMAEKTVRSYARQKDQTYTKVNKVRTSAIRKMRKDCARESEIGELVEEVCQNRKCTSEELFGNGRIGACVLARMDLYSILFDRGMTIEEMAKRFSASEEKITAAINRACNREMRPGVSV